MVPLDWFLIMTSLRYKMVVYQNLSGVKKWQDIVVGVSANWRRGINKVIAGHASKLVRRRLESMLGLKMGCRCGAMLKLGLHVLFVVKIKKTFNNLIATPVVAFLRSIKGVSKAYLQSLLILDYAHAERKERQIKNDFALSAKQLIPENIGRIIRLPRSKNRKSASATKLIMQTLKAALKSA